MMIFLSTSQVFSMGGAVDDEEEPPPAPVEVLLSNQSDDCSKNTDFNVGLGIYDITGPAAEVTLFGYGEATEQSSGIHLRLWSRAFIFESPCSGKRVVFIEADILSASEQLRLELVKKLEANNYGNLYNSDNLVFSANHTHAAPGGYSMYTVYNLLNGGKVTQNVNTIVNGVYESIVQADKSLHESTITFAKGFHGDNFNRAMKSYNLNPLNEREKFEYTTDKEIKLLRIDSPEGTPRGLMNWFPAHNTSMGNKNTLISSDHKGYAAYTLEKKKGNTYSDFPFVAGFFNANAGDSSINIEGIPSENSIDNIKNVVKYGDSLRNRVEELYNSASEDVVGDIGYRTVFVDLSDVEIDSRWTNGDGPQQTCNAAVGAAFANGAPADGPGPLSTEGLTFGDTWPKITFVPNTQECQGEKPVLIPTQEGSAIPWTPDRIPFQIIRIGQFAFVSTPFECTTMCGRRLMEMVQDVFKDDGVTEVIFSGYSNLYTGYATTREEYAAQEYAGGATYFGPYTHAAMMQIFHHLAVSLRDDTSPNPADFGINDFVSPRDLLNKTAELWPGVVFDDKPWFKDFGEVITDVSETYNKGDTVNVQFWGGHPKNNLNTMNTFLKIQKNVNGTWVDVAWDWDPETRYNWKRSGIANSKITIQWDIPKNAESGTYQIMHTGHWKSGWTKNINYYSGTSSTFTVN